MNRLISTTYLVQYFGRKSLQSQVLEWANSGTMNEDSVKVFTSKWSKLLVARGCLRWEAVLVWDLQVVK